MKTQNFIRLLFWLGFSIETVNAQDHISAGLKLATFDVDATPPVGSRLAYDPMVNS